MIGVSTSSLSNRYITEPAFGKDNSSVACSQQQMVMDTAHNHVQLEKPPAVRQVAGMLLAFSWQIAELQYGCQS